MTPFRGLRCLRGMETLPEDDIYQTWGRSERSTEDRWATLRLGDRPGGCDLDVQAEPEVVGASDAATVVLPSRARVRFGGRLKAPRVAAVTLAVIGAGVSIRLLRRPSEHRGVRSPATARHVAGVPALRRERGAARSAHRRTEASAARGAGRRRGAVHRRAGVGERRERTSRSTASGAARVRPVPTAPAEGDVPQVEPGPAADDAPAPVRPAPQPAPAPRRRPPCLPGTLGC
jgi:hypothetical protein